MDDNKIIALFFERSENAISELSNKYGKLCISLSMNIVNDYRDAEECVNESYLSVWNTVPPNHPNPLLAFLCRIVRYISINRYKRNTANKRKGNYDLCLEELADCLPSNISVEDDFEKAQLSKYINEFLESLNKTNRIIFVKRFWYMDEYTTISKAIGLSEGAIRTRLSRTKRDLKNFLEERGVRI